MKLSFSKPQLMGATPVFCVEFTWGSRVHRYATMDITLSSDDGPLHFLPTLLEFDFEESLNITSFDPETNIVMMALVMQDVDLLERWSKGDTIEGLDAEFFYVLTKRDNPEQTYEQRVTLYRGQIQEPQFGAPNEIEGLVSLSIEAQPYDSDRLLIDGNLRIDSRFDDRDLNGGDGKPYPIVIGSAGSSVYQTVGSSKNVFALPVYNVHIYDSHNDCRMMIAGHPITATFATVQDDHHDTATKPVLHDTDGRGNIYAYFELKTSDNIAMPGWSGKETSSEWWAYLTGKGMDSPYGDGALNGGGDICRWALSQSGQIVDDEAWSNLAIVLNQYNFDGYINDAKITAFDWLNGNILPFLPVSVRMGANGLRPVLIDLWALTFVDPIATLHIGDDEESVQVSPVNTLRATSDLINELTLNFAKRGHDQDYTSLIRVTNIEVEEYDVQSDYSILSINRYGKKPKVLQSDYIYDRDTAIKVASDKVRANCLPLYEIEIESPVYLGYLLVGDVVEATISDLYLTNHKMMITSKKWTGSHWSFTLAFELNPIQNQGA